MPFIFPLESEFNTINEIIIMGEIAARKNIKFFGSSDIAILRYIYTNICFKGWICIK